MAKGKHAAALFEVIHSGRYPNKPVMNTPKWWFKRNKSKDSPAAPADADAPNSSAERSDESENDPTLRAGETSAATSSDASSPADPTAGRSPFDRTEEPSEQALPRRSHASANQLDVAVDRDRRLITLKVSYNSAIITAFTLLVVVSLAYVVGRKMSRGPMPAIASETSDQLRAGPARPDVMNISPPTRSSQTASTPPQPTQPVNEPDVGSTTATNPPPAPGAEAAGQQAPTGTAPTGARMVGLNYVVVQSYPDEASAIDARDALVKSGVGATIERKLRGLRQDWFIVVGTQGFPRANGPEYSNYVKKIEEVSYQLTRAKKGAKPFTPMGFKWQKPEEEPKG